MSGLERKFRIPGKIDKLVDPVPRSSFVTIDDPNVLKHQEDFGKNLPLPRKLKQTPTP